MAAENGTLFPTAPGLDAIFETTPVDYTRFTGTVPPLNAERLRAAYEEMTRNTVRQTAQEEFPTAEYTPPWVENRALEKAYRLWSNQKPDQRLKIRFTMPASLTMAQVEEFVSFILNNSVSRAHFEEAMSTVLALRVENKRLEKLVKEAGF